MILDKKRILFAVILQKASSSINMDLITDDEYHAKMQKGSDDIVAGKT